MLVHASREDRRVNLTRSRNAISRDVQENVAFLDLDISQQIRLSLGNERQPIEAECVVVHILAAYE